MKHARSDYNERIQDAAGLIPADEPVLFIRGQDVCAVATVDAWIAEARDRDVAVELIERDHLDRSTLAWAGVQVSRSGRAFPEEMRAWAHLADEQLGRDFPWTRDVPRWVGVLR